MAHSGRSSAWLVLASVMLAAPTCQSERRADVLCPDEVAVGEVFVVQVDTLEGDPDFDPGFGPDGLPATYDDRDDADASWAYETSPTIDLVRCREEDVCDDSPWLGTSSELRNGEAWKALAPGTVTFAYALARTGNGCSGSATWTATCTVVVHDASDTDTNDDTGLADGNLGFGADLRPEDPTVALDGDSVVVAVVEYGPGSGEGGSGRTVAPLREGPDWSPIPDNPAQDAAESAMQPHLAVGSDGEVWLSRVFDTGAAMRLSVGRRAPGGDVVEEVTPSAIPVGEQPLSSALATSDGGLLHLAWIRSDGRRASYVRRDTSGAWNLGGMVVEPAAEVAMGGGLFPTLYVSAAYGSTLEQGQVLQVYVIDSDLGPNPLGALSPTQQNVVVRALSVTALADGDHVVAWRQEVSGEDPVLKVVRYEPGSDVAFAEDISPDDAGPVVATALAVGRSGNLWLASLDSVNGSVTYRYRTSDGRWTEASPPNAGGNVGSLALTGAPIGTPGWDATAIEAWADGDRSGARTVSLGL